MVQAASQRTFFSSSRRAVRRESSGICGLSVCSTYFKAANSEWRMANRRSKRPTPYSLLAIRYSLNPAASLVAARWAGARMRAEHCGDGAGGAENRRRRRRMREQVYRARSDGPAQVERGKAEAAEARFHGGPENPQEPHVEDEMEPSAVHEGVGQQRPPVRRIEAVLPRH